MILPTEATYVLEQLGVSSQESPSRRADNIILPPHSTAVQINNHVQLPTDPAAGGFGAAGRLTIGAGWLSQWEWVSPFSLNKPFRPHHDFTHALRAFSPNKQLAPAIQAPPTPPPQPVAIVSTSKLWLSADDEHEYIQRSSQPP